MAEDGQPDVSFWIAKVRDGEQIAHFVKPLYWTDDTLDGSEGEGVGNVSKLYGRLFYRDETCHADYAKHLIPRAVGYSAALIDYFFRGKITLEKAPTGAGYVVVNNTDEAMAGTFILAYDTTSDRRKALWNKTFNLGAKGAATSRSTPFDFVGPIDAKTPGEYMLVFNGTLGAESDTVVGALVQIPTVVVIHEGFYLQCFTRVCEATLTTPSIRGVLAFRPPMFGSGAYGWVQGKMRLTMQVGGGHAVSYDALTYDFFRQQQPLVDTGYVSDGAQSLTMRFESTTEDALYFNQTFSVDLIITTLGSAQQ